MKCIICDLTINKSIIEIQDKHDIFCDSCCDTENLYMILEDIEMIRESIIDIESQTS